MRSHFCIVLFAAACATGSAGSPDAGTTSVVRATIRPQQTIELTRHHTIHANEYAATRGQVWSALVAAEKEIGVPLQAADSNAGTVTYYVQSNTPSIAGRSASVWVDCGNGPGGVPRATTYRITLKVTAVVERVGESHARLRTMLVGAARDRGLSADELPCTSTGQFEKRLLAIVGARLAS